MPSDKKISTEIRSFGSNLADAPHFRMLSGNTPNGEALEGRMTQWVRSVDAKVLLSQGVKLFKNR